MIYKSYIGIDPGNTGGICVITDDHAEAYKTPGTIADMSDLINTITIDHERAIAYPIARLPALSLIQI